MRKSKHLSAKDIAAKVCDVSALESVKRGAIKSFKVMTPTRERGIELVDQMIDETINKTKGTE